MPKHTPGHHTCEECAFLTRIKSDPDEPMKSCFVNPVPRRGKTPSCREFVPRVEREEE